MVLFTLHGAAKPSFLPLPCIPPVEIGNSICDPLASLSYLSLPLPPFFFFFFAVVIEDDRIDDVLKTMTDKAPPGV